MEVGDLVRLKSGGPEMTVVGDDAGLIMLAWWDGEKVSTDALPASCLVSADKICYPASEAWRQSRARVALVKNAWSLAAGIGIWYDGGWWKINRMISYDFDRKLVVVELYWRHFGYKQVQMSEDEFWGRIEEGHSYDDK